MYVLHPWHGADNGDKTPEIVNALIEIPQGSRCKYEIDKKTGLLKTGPCYLFILSLPGKLRIYPTNIRRRQ